MGGWIVNEQYCYFGWEHEKRGNTDLLAQAFAEGARENNSVDIVSVADYKVNPCIGCNSCFMREGNKCFQNDDMDGIYEKLKVG